MRDSNCRIRRRAATGRHRAAARARPPTRSSASSKTSACFAKLWVGGVQAQPGLHLRTLLSSVPIASCGREWGWWSRGWAALTGEKEKTASEEAVDCDLEKWLPLEQRLRNLLLMPTPSLVAAIESGSRLQPRKSW